MMESETNDSADNEGADYGEPSKSNIQSEDQHLRSLLTDLNKDQLVDIVVELGMKIPQAAEEIRGAARHTARHRKLIVHGLGEKTTSETLGNAFSSYGEVEDAYVVVDIATGKSRSVGIITFKSLESVKKALEKPKTWVDGRLAYQLPAPEAQIADADVDPRNLFVTRISSDVTNNKFLRFFKKYGEIEKGSLFFDRSTRTSSGTGYVTFKTVEAAKAAIADPNKILAGNKISVDINWLKKKEKEVQEEESVTNAPHVHNSPSAIAPQHDGLQSQVPRPHFSAYEPHAIPLPNQPPTVANQPQEPHGIPLTHQPPTIAYQPHFRGYESYGIPLPYQPPTVAYQPHFSGYEAYGIPLAHQPPTVAYQPHFSGYEAYGIPLAHQPPTVAYQPHFSGYEAYGIPVAYQPPTIAYQPHFSGYETYGIPLAYQPPTIAYPAPTRAYRAYPPATRAYQPRTGAYRAYPPSTGAYQRPT
ncbi:UBP1-associated protein 2B-like [Dendrobium catenatum]|uniref:Heterogeneous nuclear ribonucleoprotein 1 n=1 Tax=Dendrobium catenatum TaxID=906689 RepID=A0A2I0X460_9ASPA|nr:UBP1-associated protein 2B-like [Dendrobium catenatum]PKU82696.1 Heterogeneous nuclear ribonucleoprotein 1 [Dendrobium catenatum]